MNIESISSIARSRRAELYDVATARRAVRTLAMGEARPGGLRVALARTVLGVGDICYLIGHMLIPGTK